MNIIITGRKVILKEAFKQRVEQKLRKLDKFFEEDAEAHVTVRVERERQIVEVTVRNRGMIYRAEESTKDMLSSFDSAVDVLVRQINGNKARLAKRLRAGAFEGEQLGQPEDYGEIRIKRFPVKPMSVEEAILQMDMLGHAFFTFMDADTQQIRVAYKRRDGGYGILVPEQG